MTDCELCGSCDWTTVDRNWIRCNACGRLETRLPDRTCAHCGKPLGRFTKPTQTACIKCKEIKVYESEIPCQTPGCGNTLGKRADPRGYCRQCLQEMQNWTTNEGHLWKTQAMRLMKRPIARKTLLKTLSKTYPELTPNTLLNWILRQTKAGILERTGHGTYRALSNGKPSPQRESPQSIRIDPDAGSTFGSIRVTRIKTPDD